MSEAAWVAEWTRTRPRVVRMGEFTTNPGKWLGEAAERRVVLVRHGRPVAVLRPAADAKQPANESAALDATQFARNAKQVIADVGASGQAQPLARYGKPWVVVEPFRVKNFDGLVLARALDEAIPPPSGKAVSYDDFARSLDLDE